MVVRGARLAERRRPRRRRGAVLARRLLPDWLFLRVTGRRIVKNRIHFDFVPDDQQAEVNRLLGMGARRIDIARVSRAGWCLPTPTAVLAPG